MRSYSPRPSSWKAMLGLWGLWLAFGPSARSQELPSASPPAQTTQAPRPPSSPPPAAPITIEQLAERLHAMEAMNRKLTEELATTRREQKEQMRQILERLGERPQPSNDRTDDAGRDRRGLNGIASPIEDAQAAEINGMAPPSENALSAEIDSPVPDYTEGQFSTATPAPGYPSSKTSDSKRMPLLGSFGPGFRFQTEDEKFRLQVHYESQIEGRFWQQSDQVPANSGFFLPRQRIFFDGNITKSIEYELSINRGSNNINLAERLHQSTLRRPFPVPHRPLLYAAPLRSVRDLELLVADPRAVDLHHQSQPQPPDRADGLGIPLRQTGRLCGRDLQRLAELVREPAQRCGLRRLSQCETVPGVGVPAIPQVPEPWHIGRFRRPRPGARAQDVPDRRRLPGYQHPRAGHGAVPDPQSQRDRAGRNGCSGPSTRPTSTRACR